MLTTFRKVIGLFEPAEVRRLAIIVIAMVLTGLLQTVGIASIMPFLAVVSSPAVVRENPYFAQAFDTLGFDDTREFLVALGVLFVALMVAANGLATLTNWATVRLQWRTQVRLSHRLLSRYVEAPYGFHLYQNSAKLGKTLLGDVNRVISGVLIPGLNMLARIISTAFIVALLVWADPLLALVVSSVVGGFYGLLYAVVRKRQARLGDEATVATKERFQVANEAFGGIKDLKVLGREDFVLTRFSEPAARYARAHAAHGMLAVLPRFALETLAYGGIVVVILYLLETRESLDQVIPLLAIYAFGTNRLMPAVQEIFQSLTQVRFNTPALEAMYADLRSDDLARLKGLLPSTPHQAAVQGAGAPAMSVKRNIRFEDVAFRYPRAEESTLCNVNLEIPANHTVAFVGETGAGKTTLVDLLLGLFEPTEGRILVDDVPLDVTTVGAWRKNVGYVPQAIFLGDATIAENIAFGIPKRSIDFDAVEAAASAAHLDEFVRRIPGGYETVVGERGVRLSGGQRQRIGIARALYHNPSVIVMDEATSALDNVTEGIVMQAIHELGEHRTIILIAHRLSTVRECDVIYVVEGGRVTAAGRYDDLVSSHRAFREMARD